MTDLNIDTILCSFFENQSELFRELIGRETTTLERETAYALSQAAHLATKPTDTPAFQAVVSPTGGGKTV